MDLNRDILVNRFKNYISFDTQSDEDKDKVCPSTSKQLIFAKSLAAELSKLGLADIELDEHGYIMATLPENGIDDAPVVGLISHMDTSPDASGANIKPKIVHNFDGNDVILNAEKNIKFSVTDFPEIKKYVGQDIMFTDGTTLLGADDKAGVTAIVSAVEYLLAHPELKHGKIRVGFTPDEEIGTSALRFDVAKFAADFAYTVDGGELGGLEYENFNADNVTITFKGRSVHTGSAKGKMINALSIASEWQQMLPAGEKPEFTAGYEGFFHVHKLSGGVESCTMSMLVRDHDREKFIARKKYLERQAEWLNSKYGEGTVTVKHHDVYYNMLEKIEDGNIYVVELAKKAMKASGVTPIIEPIRGGTDGAQLSFKGLPCPNIFTGGANFHGCFEYLPLNSLQKATETIVNIILGAGKLKK